MLTKELRLIIKYTLLVLNKILLAFWEIILVDFIRELSMSQRFNTIYIIIDYFSK